MDNTHSAESFWDREVVTPRHVGWMDAPGVREYICRSLSGTNEGLWPIDWLRIWLNGRRFNRALSIGCGTGALERDLARKNLVESIDAFDGSTNSVRLARQAAGREGMSSRIRYFVADFDDPALPRWQYDAVFIHQAAHHVRKLEKLFRAILRTLKPDGMLYLDEYIGPSRHDWNDETMARYRRLFAMFPAELRLAPELPLPVQYDDPSEAIRSNEILPQLRIGFDVRAMRGYGGNILALIAPWLDAGRSPESFKRLIDEERRVLASGEPPFYALIVATPKRGAARLVASARYFVEPKVKRIGREIRLTANG